MADMLVKLFELPELQPRVQAMRRQGIEVRRPNAWEKRLLIDWVRENFNARWSLECEAAFSSRPPSCWIAVKEHELIGFACYDCTRKNFFGPAGVARTLRGKGIGTALLLAGLHSMWNAGYAYAIIGGVGPVEYYQRTVGAILIDGSAPGIYDFSLIMTQREFEQGA